MIDGGPIVSAITGIDRPSLNAKTGPMLQNWILCADTNPLSALRDGADVSVCGDCKLRGDGGKGRTCYVAMHRAPLNVFKSLGEATPVQPKQLVKQAIRLGSYGDPAAVPTERTHYVVKLARMVTGYTHQWRTCDQELKKFLMASVDSEQERDEAKQMGWATFRIKKPLEPVLKGEVVCPASLKERSCLTCGLCKGGNTCDVVIDVHGAGAKRYINNKGE